MKTEKSDLVVETGSNGTKGIGMDNASNIAKHWKSSFRTSMHSVKVIITLSVKSVADFLITAFAATGQVFIRDGNRPTLGLYC
jgi:hypothetical protein